ncbi:ATP-dependent Clp protease ATP-binding subunit ClpC [Spirochaetia bacterium]|nr:ATP-dependent Clp protease ATP-binding subunit ClpC [Spirochaetia bacterium]
MLNKYTQRLQRILSRDAQEEARFHDAGAVLPEHLIIALLREGRGTACQALRYLHVDLQDFLEAIEKGLPPPQGFQHEKEVPYSERTKKVLNRAVEESRIMGNEFIGTEHIMFAAMREPNSLAALYMKQHSVDFDTLKVVVQTTFNQPKEAGIHDDFWEETDFMQRGFSLGTVSSFGNTVPMEIPSLVKPHIKTASYPTLTPTLDEFSRDLTAQATVTNRDPVIGRQKEIQRALRILARRSKNNPVLVGEPGVGKTSIVEGLVNLFAGGSIPEALAGKRILSLEMGLVVAGTKYRGEFEERIKKMMKEIRQAGNIILFIDEIHTLIGAGGAEGTIDASNMLKPSLSRGEIQCIGATTLQEYRKYFEKDGALERRFQAIFVEEPDLNDTIKILEGLRSHYEEHHHVRYTNTAVQSAAKLAQRYIFERFMPDKAIDLLDEAGAMKKIEQGKTPPEFSDIELDIKKLTEKKSQMVSTQDYERAAELRDHVRKLRSRLDSVRSSWEQASRKVWPTVTESDVREVVSEITGIPLNHLEEAESKRLLKMEEELHRALIGQDEAVNRIASSIRRSRVGISAQERPLGSFVFLGPTGVGKTLLAKRLAQYLFNDEQALIRIDMSDYMEKHNASRLVGAPPGYIGYETGGILTEKIRRNPYRVVLFDEIEKAHHDIFNLLLQVLEEGELRDNLGHTVSFRNTVIIMTSNAGAKEISKDGRLGFNTSSTLSPKELEALALGELKRLFSPEFINRLDDIIVFQPLTQKQVELILDLELDKLNGRLAEHGFSLKVQPAARHVLIEHGWDPKYGARPMRRTIQRELEEPLARLILENNFSGDTIFQVSAQKGKLFVKPLVCSTFPVETH